MYYNSCKSPFSLNHPNLELGSKIRQSNRTLLQIYNPGILLLLQIWHRHVSDKI